MKSSGYEEFVEKFKTKKTTDDCYTPPIVYDAVADFVAEEFGIEKNLFVRPFYPGGNYRDYEYPIGCVVVDNPPFSILAEIKSFYNSRNIKFFLFAPHLTIFSGKDTMCSYYVVGSKITYENGACVSTSFVTNMANGEFVAKSCPKLYNSIKKANDVFVRSVKNHLPKYQYPMNVITSSDFAYLSKNGIDFSIHREDSCFIRCLDEQKKIGKGLFGSGYLISERAAAERAAAERAAERAAAERAAERAAAERAEYCVWELSENEKNIVSKLR